MYAYFGQEARFFEERMNRDAAKCKAQPAQGHRRYLRLRALQRVGLLGPLIRLQRRIEGR
jgi:hypothetical protein